MASRDFTAVGDVLEQVRAMERSASYLALTAREGQLRVLATREVERQVQRALWRAERRARRLPERIRRTEEFIQRRRRAIAKEIIRWARSVGASQELANELAQKAAERYPRKLVAIIPSNRPRARGTNPRAMGTNPRARGESPRQRRERKQEEGDDPGK